MAGKEPKIGNKAPAFSLDATGGGKIALTDLAGSWIVFYFYPKASTSG